MFHDECEKKYVFVVECEKNPWKANEFRAVAVDHRWDGRGDDQISLQDLLEAKSTMNKGTSNGGGTNTVPQHPQTLPMVFSFWLLGVCMLRHNGVASIPFSRKLNVLMCLAQKHVAITFQALPWNCLA